MPYQITKWCCDFCDEEFGSSKKLCLEHENICPDNPNNQEENEKGPYHIEDKDNPLLPDY